MTDNLNGDIKAILCVVFAELFVRVEIIHSLSAPSLRVMLWWGISTVTTIWDDIIQRFILLSSGKSFRVVLVKIAWVALNYSLWNERNNHLHK